MDASYINHIIHRRRSVYPVQYMDAEVRQEIVEQMLENANRAPTHKRTEPWRFVVYYGEGRRTLGELQAAVYKKVTEADGTFKEERYRNLLNSPMKSSHIILVYMKRDPARSVPEIEEVGAVFCAIQNMYLTATAYGIGCYMSTGGITYFEEAKKAFGLEPDDRIIGFVHVGIPRGETPVSDRRPVREKTRWIGDHGTSTR
jgi:nitroreductase